MKYVDIVFGVTPARCYFAEEELGVPYDRIRLLPVGADEDEANKVATSSKNKYSDDLRVVTGGKWIKGKGLEELIEGVKDTKNCLTIFGKTSDPYTRNLIDKSPKNVNFVGWQGRASTLQLLKDADIAIWPKYHTTLIEDAIAVKTPVVLRYNGNTSHFIRGNGAYLFTNLSKEIKQLFSLLSNSRELIEYMKTNTVKMLGILSYNRVAKESIEYYTSLEPKFIHNIFMNDSLCDPENESFKRYVRTIKQK